MKIIECLSKIPPPNVTKTYMGSVGIITLSLWSTESFLEKEQNSTVL